MSERFAVGRPIGKPNLGTYLTFEGLQEVLSMQPAGIYYLRGFDKNGIAYTLPYAHVQ